MPQGEPSHAEMIAALELAIERLQIDAEGHEEPAVRLASALVADNLRAVRAHLERTQWRPRSEIADSTLGLDTEVLGFQPDIGNEAEDEIPSRYGITTAGHLASGGWEKCTHYMPLPPSPETP